MEDQLFSQMFLEVTCFHSPPPLFCFYQGICFFNWLTPRGLIWFDDMSHVQTHETTYVCEKTAAFELFIAASSKREKKGTDDSDGASSRYLVNQPSITDITVSPDISC